MNVNCPRLRLITWLIAQRGVFRSASDTRRRARLASLVIALMSGRLDGSLMDHSTA